MSKANIALRSIRLLKAITMLKPNKPLIGVCLEGDTALRVEATSKLYQDKKISRVIVTGGVNEPELDRLPAELMKQRLISMGIPENRIEVEEKSLNTFDHAVFVSEMALERDFTELLIITSGYHLLRAYLTFLKQVLIRNRPFTIYGYSAGSASSWFRKSPTEGRYRVLLFFFEELRKIETYKHDLASIVEAEKYLNSLKQQ